MKKIKVIQLIGSLELGGIEILTTDLMRNINSNDDLDVLLISNKKGPLEDELKNGIIKYKILERKKFFDFKFIYRLRKIARSQNVNVIHSHQPIHGFYTLIASLGLNIKKVQSYHGLYQKIKDRLIAVIVNLTNNSNIAVSSAFKKRLLQTLNVKDNFEVIYNGIDASKFNSNRGNIRKELGITKDDILIGTVGNFYSEVRDHLTVCRALPQVFSKYKNVHFVFVGGYHKQNSFQYDQCYNYCVDNNILNRVHFLGTRTDISEILNSLDLFVFSSVDDSFGISILEAMFSRVPTIISDIPPFQEISDLGKYSILFKKKSSTDLSLRMIDLIESTQKRKHLSNSAYEWANKKFTIQAYKNKLINHYKILLN